MSQQQQQSSRSKKEEERGTKKFDRISLFQRRTLSGTFQSKWCLVFTPLGWRLRHLVNCCSTKQHMKYAFRIYLNQIGCQLVVHCCSVLIFNWYREGTNAREGSSEPQGISVDQVGQFPAVIKRYTEHFKVHFTKYPSKKSSGVTEETR